MQPLQMSWTGSGNKKERILNGIRKVCVCVSCTRLFIHIAIIYTSNCTWHDRLPPCSLSPSFSLSLSLLLPGHSWLIDTHLHTHTLPLSDWNFIIIVNAVVTHTTTTLNVAYSFTWRTYIENWLNWTLMTLNRAIARVKTSKATTVYGCCCCWK